MKKSYIIIIVVLCVIYYIIHSYISVFTDPGGNNKYDIDVSSCLSTNVTQNDIKYFNKNIYPKIYTEILSNNQKHEFIYNPQTRQKVSTCNDTIIDLHISSKICNGSNDLFFVTALMAIFAHGNDSINPHFLGYTIFSTAIFEDKQLSIIKCIKAPDSGYGYDKAKIVLSDEVVSYSMMRNIQHVFIDYDYYYNLPFVKIHNSTFWKNLQK